MDNPLVTIITVTYNLIKGGREKCFRHCVESIRMQDYPNIEHLVIDGASTDGTIELLQKLGLNYISEPDSGVYNAYNKGIRLAKGKYLAFMNSDDCYNCADAVRLSVEKLEQSQADFTYAEANMVFADGRKKPLRPFFNFITTPFCHQTMMSSAEMLKTLHGFNEKYFIFADFDQITRALLSGRRAVDVGKCIVDYSAGGISGARSPELTQQRIEVIRANCDISLQQAEHAAEYGFLPRPTLLALLAKTTDFPNPEKLLKRNRKQFLRYLRRQLISVRWSKHKRCIRLLGITFYKIRIKT